MEKKFEPTATCPDGSKIVFRDGAWRDASGVPVDLMGRPVK